MKKDKEPVKEEVVPLTKKDRDVIVSYLESLTFPVGQARELLKIIDFLKGLK